MGKSEFQLGQKVQATVVRSKTNMKTPLKLKGKFQIEHWRKGKLIATYEVPNGITNVGKDHILGVAFNEIANTPTWFLGVVDNSGFTAFADGDTMASHAGWNEFTTYSQPNRVEWIEGAASSQQITNPSPSTFDITGSGTLQGIFLVSENTKGGTSGILWATAPFSSTIPVVNTDQLKITYTITAS